MSKATIPEPVAWLLYCPAATFKHATTENVETKRLSDGSVVYTSSPLVMASEMEAYAAAKVREALEEAAEVAESCVCSCCCSDDQKFTAQDAAQRIRALIPATPA